MMKEGIEMASLQQQEGKPIEMKKQSSKDERLGSIEQRISSDEPSSTHIKQSIPSKQASGSNFGAYEFKRNQEIEDLPKNTAEVETPSSTHLNSL